MRCLFRSRYSAIFAQHARGAIVLPGYPGLICHAPFRLTLCVICAFILQVNVGNKYNSDAGLAERCSARQGDFQTLPFEDAQFDAAYQIEATCHSPDKVRLCFFVSKLCCMHDVLLCGGIDRYR